MVKRSMVGFSKNPATLFAMYLQVSTSDPYGVDMVPCHSVVILFNPPSRINLKPLHYMCVDA